MTAASDTADFSDRPWMDPESESSESGARKPKSSKWSEPLAWRAACHGAPVLAWFMPVLGVGMMIPLLIWQVKARKEGDLALSEEAVEALNFQINVAVLSFILSATIIGLAIVPIVWIVATVFALVATVKVYRGKEYSYPWIMRPIKADAVVTQ